MPRRSQILICGILGFVSNVWLAQHCLFEQWGPSDPWLPRSPQWYWNLYADESDTHGPATLHQASGAMGCDFQVIDASRSDIVSAAPPRMMITRAGFPLRSFEGMHSWGPVTPSHSWAIPIEPRRPNVAWLSVVPFRPLLLGLAVNTILYGSLAWLAIFGPSAVYRRMQTEHRKRLQCCWQCGYDLQGDLSMGCPECGWRRE